MLTDSIRTSACWGAHCYTSTDWHPPLPCTTQSFVQNACWRQCPSNDQAFYLNSSKKMSKAWQAGRAGPNADLYTSKIPSTSPLFATGPPYPYTPAQLPSAAAARTAVTPLAPATVCVCLFPHGHACERTSLRLTPRKK